MCHILSKTAPLTLQHLFAMEHQQDYLTPPTAQPEDSEDVPEEPIEEPSTLTPMRTVIVFVVIIGCFAVVYPRFIHPMFKYAINGGSLEKDEVEKRFLPPKFQQRAASLLGQQQDRGSKMRERPTHHPGSRFTGDYAHVPESKGSLYLMLPLYTIGIIAFLMYTFYKVLAKNNQNVGYASAKDIRYNPVQQQFTRGMEKDVPVSPVKRRNGIDATRSRNLQKSPSTPDDDEPKISEFQLKALETKLQETEAQMNALIAQMAVMKTLDKSQINNVSDEDADLSSGNEVDDEQEMFDLECEEMPDGPEKSSDYTDAKLGEDDDLDNGSGDENIDPELERILLPTVHSRANKTSDKKKD